MVQVSVTASGHAGSDAATATGTNPKPVLAVTPRGSRSVDDEPLVVLPSAQAAAAASLPTLTDAHGDVELGLAAWLSGDDFGQDFPLWVEDVMGSPRLQVRV